MEEIEAAKKKKKSKSPSHYSSRMPTLVQDKTISGLMGSMLRIPMSSNSNNLEVTAEKDETN